MIDEKRPASSPPRAPAPPSDYRIPSTPPGTAPPPRRRSTSPLPPPSSTHPDVQRYRNKLQSIADNELPAISFLDPELEELLEKSAPPPPKEPEK